jgi:FlaA1/EpsC-like NDP-sugar epimerase
MNILNLIGRHQELFTDDLEVYENLLSDIISNSRFLVIGGGGSIGQAVTKEIFKRNPLKLHVVDISENNLVELVRDIRSTYGYIKGDFQTFALDVGSYEYDCFWSADGQFDYFLNLSALKHVRSERDPFTLMRMIEVNIINTSKTLSQCIENGVKKYFCVSTDKAANPVNMMGASKRIMEMFVNRRSKDIDVSMARFANVAFSDGSLLYGFEHRIKKSQPIVAPNDIKRYFIIPKESGELCLMSCILGANRDIYFPKLKEELHLITFKEIAEKYLNEIGLKPYACQNEEEARNYFAENSIFNAKIKNWPCLFKESDTTGEKKYEEFYSENEILDLDLYQSIGVIKNKFENFDERIGSFEIAIRYMKERKKWTKNEILDLFNFMIPGFQHRETGKNLDEKM